MNPRKLYCLAAVCFSLAAAGLVLLLARTEAARAAPALHCVNQSGSGCAAAYGSRCYASLQDAIDAAAMGDEIRIAGGVYTHPGGTVATITGELRILGGYNASCSLQDPEQNITTLDGQWAGPVVWIDNAGDVMLMHLAILHGNGGQVCGPGSGCGGGIYVQNTSLHLFHSAVTDNIANKGVGWGSGGGIYSLDSLLEIRASTISSNTAGSAASDNYGIGGGIYAARGEFLIAESQVSDNIGSYNYSGSGGIVLSDVAHAQVLSSTLSNNQATYASIYWSGAGAIEINASDARIAGNRIVQNGCNASCYAGGVFFWQSSGTLDGNWITDNNAGFSFGSGGYGGGAAVLSDDPNLPVTLTNNLIAGSQTGAGVYIEQRSPGSPVRLFNNTIADNAGSALLVTLYAEPELVNNLISGHSLGIQVWDPFTGTLTADTNLFWNTSDPIVGANPIQEPPRLKSNYTPMGSSPAVDAGLPLAWLSRDLAGSPRPQHSAWDIGAYEWIQDLLFLPLIHK